MTAARLIDAPSVILSSSSHLMPFALKQTPNDSGIGTLPCSRQGAEILNMA